MRPAGRILHWPSKYAKMHFRPGLSPDHAGSSRRSPKPIIGWRGDIPPQTPPSSLAMCLPEFQPYLRLCDIILSSTRLLFASATSTGKVAFWDSIKTSATYCYTVSHLLFQSDSLQSIPEMSCFKTFSVFTIGSGPHNNLHRGSLSQSQSSFLFNWQIFTSTNWTLLPASYTYKSQHCTQDMAAKTTVINNQAERWETDKDINDVTNKMFQWFTLCDRQQTVQAVVIIMYKLHTVIAMLSSMKITQWK